MEGHQQRLKKRASALVRIPLSSSQSTEQKLFVKSQTNDLSFCEDHFSDQPKKNNAEGINDDFVVIETLVPDTKVVNIDNSKSSLTNVMAESSEETFEDLGLPNDINGTVMVASDVIKSTTSNDSFEGFSSLKMSKSYDSASRGSQSELGSGTKPKQNVLPSQILLDSASKIKSYMIPNYEKTAGDIKAGVVDAINKVKYGFNLNMQTSFSKDNPIYMLGRAYHRNFTEQDSGCCDVETFKKEFQTLMWFTYRKNFDVIDGSKLKTDAGWGCMLRSGQMILGTGLRRHFLPHGYIYHKRQTFHEDTIHNRILNWFYDSSQAAHVFSLHQLVKSGKDKFNRDAGSWYGPSCVAHIIKDAVLLSRKHFPEIEGIEVIVAQDGAVYIQDVLDSCLVEKCICSPQVQTSFTSSVQHKQLSVSEEYDVYDSYLTDKNNPNEETLRLSIPTNYFVTGNYLKYSDSIDVTKSTCGTCKAWKSCIILVPTRLGGSEVNPVYYQCIQRLFLYDLCIGIIGGKPKHSLYFVGFQDEYLIHLDPHVCQDLAELRGNRINPSTYHCTHPHKMHIKKMAPSCTIGFYCHTRDQFDRLVRELPELVTTKELNGGTTCLFEMVEGKFSNIVNEFVELEIEVKTPSTDDIEELIL